MTTKVWTLLLLLGVLACFSVINAQSKIGFNQVLSHLGNFQSTNGGFRNAEGLETAGATSSALLLSSLYGLKAKINTVEAAKFLASLENKDGGYGAFVGAPSDIESTRNALVGLARLGVKPANPTSTAAYLKSQVDSTGLFGGAIRSSALALQSFELLGQKIPSDLASGVKDALKKETSFGDAVSDIYYAVLASTLTGFDVPADQVAKSILDLQSPQNGLFFIDNTKAGISAESTADALLALNLLGSKYIDSVDVARLRSAVRYVPLDIEQVADIHVALAVTKAYRDNFLTATAASPVIVEGSEFRPAVALSARESGVAHSDFDVTSKHTFFGKSATKGKLAWIQEAQAYVGDALATLGNFGPVESVYTFSTVVPGVGPLSFDVLDTKNVGYGIIVTPKATIELSGREVKENEQVTVGTDFKFDVALSSNANAQLLSGDFIVTFSVLDSSNVVIYKSNVDGSSNKDTISFSYKLASADIPAGKLSFKFDVATKSGAVHTTNTVSYNLAIALVASNIVFEQKANTYKIGDTVKFTFEPATFPDLRTPHPLATKDANGADATASRHFFLDVRSPQGALLRSIEGTATKSASYSFSFPVEATFSSIGVNALTFRYKPASGEDVILQNFDSSVGELYEDINVLNYTVKAELSLVELTEKPTATEFVYGDSVVYKFRVKDAVSGKYVVGSESTANVYLELQNDQAGRSVASVNVPAFSVKDQIVANWTINPNAHTGSGVLTLSVIDADGKKIPLKDSVKQTVTIGGEITFDTHTISTNSLDSTFTTFVVDLGLFCREKPLKDAQLKASVFFEDSTTPLATLPVATFDGRYTVSFASAHRDAKSGNYRFEFFREVDRLLALERQQAKDKEARKKGDEVKEEEVKVDAIVTVTVAHSAPRFTQLPVKAEFLALITFGGIVVWLINKRSNLK